MTGYVSTAQGRRFQLPVPLAWELNYTAGTPCDSFWFQCPWEGSELTNPSEWVRFSAQEEGETVFTGVVDECEHSWDSAGSRLEISGRGMAALLLDNEALSQDYGTATLPDILRDHVTPYGIALGECQNIPAVSQFSVAVGSSEWSVLYDFARYHGGITPRFDHLGRLVLAGWIQSENRLIGDAAPVTKLTVRTRRYGVLSEIWVRDRTRQAIETVANRSFQEGGGQCRRVMTMPGRSDYKAMRYSGQFQLDKSQAQLQRLELTVAVPFYGQPGDLVRLQRSGWAANGTYRAVEARVRCDAQGARTQLELAQPDVVL